MISDHQLDDYNRYRLFTVFTNYLYYLPVKEDRLKGLEGVLQALTTLPPYLQRKVSTEALRAP